ncbi:Uncharacterized protein APZ42_006192, partial [Daphnia magna]
KLPHPHGKLPRRFLGAGPAINTFQAPISSSSVDSPFIEVDVFRIGKQRALIDTGARNSIIREELLRNRTAFSVWSSNSSWCSVNGQKLPAFGETSLSVRGPNGVVDLNKVVVMENTLYPLVLGADWIAASGISLTFSNGTWICEIAGQERKAMSEKEPTPKHAEPPPDPRVKPVGESINVDASTSSSSHGFEQAVQKLRLLGSLIWENPNRRAERAAKLLIRPTKTRRIPGANFGFIEARVPADHDGLWMLTTTGSSRLGREWISPSCLLKSEANIVRVPVLNIGTT